MRKWEGGGSGLSGRLVYLVDGKPNGTIREIGNRKKESANGYLGELNCAKLRLGLSKIRLKPCHS